MIALFLRYLVFSLVTTVLDSYTYIIHISRPEYQSPKPKPLLESHAGPHIGLLTCELPGRGK